jgi:hypothetical protein
VKTGPGFISAGEVEVRGFQPEKMAGARLWTVRIIGGNL